MSNVQPPVQYPVEGYQGAAVPEALQAALIRTFEERGYSHHGRRPDQTGDTSWVEIEHCRRKGIPFRVLDVALEGHPFSLYVYRTDRPDKVRPPSAEDGYTHRMLFEEAAAPKAAEAQRIAPGETVRIRVKDLGGRYAAGETGVLVENDNPDKYAYKVMLPPEPAPKGSPSLFVVDGMIDRTFYFYEGEVEAAGGPTQALAQPETEMEDGLTM